MIRIDAEWKVVLLTFFSYLIVLLQITGYSMAVSFIFAITFVLILLIWIDYALPIVEGTDRIIIPIVVIALINVAFNALLTANSNISFNYFKKIIMFISTLLYFSAATKINLTEKLKALILNGNIVLSGFVICYYLVNKQSLMYMNGMQTRYLVLNMGNPNKAGLFICVMAILVAMFVSFNKKLIFKVVGTCIFAFLCKMLYETESRTAMLALGVFLIMYVYSIIDIGKQVRFNKVVIFVIVWWPLIFAFLYLSLLPNDNIASLFSFMVSEGKGLDARLVIWEKALFYIKQSPIIGAYSQISSGTGVSQLHNTHIDIWVSYGSVVLLLTGWFLYKLICIFNEIIKDNRNATVAMVGFLAVLFLGCGEAALFSGGMGLNIMCTGLLLLMKPISDNKSMEEKV